ncbi:MAG: hypothetical protein KGJ57_20720 [Sphingomonadales bacterium]|nr:hypothetical protein [Sphingomonadales bacterium]MDE2171819.1 hypothetical protein [Sphingomonadales bacterium]
MRFQNFASAFAVLAAGAMLTTPASSQQSAAPGPAELTREQIAAASAAMHQKEMELAGVEKTVTPRAGRDRNDPNFANFDEAKADTGAPLPPLLTASNGTKITTAANWWRLRRPQIVAAFESEVYGRVPANAPRIRWRVTETVKENVGGHRMITRKLVGHADNAAAPDIKVDILMNVTTPADAKGRVPLMLMIGSLRPFHLPAGFKLAQPKVPSAERQMAAAGWGYATIDTASIQADNSAGLTAGVIGLANHGQMRHLHDWGVLRAWAWGCSRALDWMQTDSRIDAHRVGIFGHSRNGKAALVALAFDQRFAAGYISSSGAGGAALLRRNYGEGIGNLTSDEAHWFTPAFLKYGAVGHSPAELPVDAHELIALVAPRKIFIGGGMLMLDPPDLVPGDAWVDPRGMFMAASAASPVWKLLGSKGLETTQFPKLGTALTQGSIGFRQHEYGHTPLPNWSTFIGFMQPYWGPAHGA